jgi:hypothetical protein
MGRLVRPTSDMDFGAYEDLTPVSVAVRQIESVGARVGQEWGSGGGG